MTERIGFIGVGDIGAPIAQRIEQAGYPLRVYNRSAAKTYPFAERGVPIAGSIAELAGECDIVFACVSDTAAVENVVFGAGGLAQSGRPGMLFVDVSTIHPVTTREMSARLKRDHGIGWVDAPVSGGPSGARAGTLAVFAGGDAEDLERARPVLMSFAGRVTHMGASGSGMAGKACNQMLSFATATVIAETLNLAARFGMNPALLPEAIAGGFADSNVMRHFGRAMIESTYRGNTKTAVKDMDIAVDLARLTGSPIPMTGLVASIFRIALAQGCTDGGLGSPMRLYSLGPLVPHAATGKDK
jgi:3-hydroxyisobutyrate dehydrogenase